MFTYGFSRVSGTWAVDPVANHRHHFQHVEVTGTLDVTDTYVEFGVVTVTGQLSAHECAGRCGGRTY